MRKNIRCAGLLALCLGVGLQVWAENAAKPAVKESTLDHLQILYNRECNAELKYQAFAGKAKAEGYLRVASLFLTIARSERIQADHHAQAMKALHGTPKIAPEPVRTETTRKNLEAALAGETSDIEKTLPEFLNQAESEKQVQAARAFGGAKVIESVHVAWYKQALENLPAWKTSGRFYVCKVCGNVVDKLNFEYCPICKEPRSGFIGMEIR
jgi:rubrerythrin